VKSPKVTLKFSGLTFEVKLNTKSTVAPLLADGKDKTSMKFLDREKANILQKQFVSVFTEEPISELPDFESRTEVEIQPLHITEEMVYKKIMELDINKACGPDEIHPRFVKELGCIYSMRHIQYKTLYMNCAMCTYSPGI